MTHIEDFFITANSVYNISEEEYQQKELLIKSFEAISRSTYQSIYIIDYYKKNFLYVAENPLFLCGHTSEEIKKLGFMFYIDHVPLLDQKMLTEINKVGF